MLRFLTLTVILLVCIVLTNQQSHSTVVSRAATVATDTQRIVTNQGSNYAGSSRWYIWRGSLPIIESHFWLGTGPDTFENAFHPDKAGAQKYLNGQSMANGNNNYLQIAATLGTPALLIFLAFLYRVLSALRRIEAQDGRYLLSAGLFASLIGYLVQAAFNIDVIMVAPLFYITLGMAYRRFLDA